jgi:hypothetical protein
MYVAGVGDTLKGFQLQSNGTFNTTAILPSLSHIFQGSGAAPSITWNIAGLTTDAIVWALDTSGDGTLNGPASAAVLYSYGAVPNGSGTLSYLWDTSAYNSSVPGSPGAVKFVVPTVADGKIFLAGGNQNYYPGQNNYNNSGVNCVTPSATQQPTNCGALAMFK